MLDTRLPFDLSGQQCYAMRDFTFHGQRFAQGDRFPWRQLSCSIRKAQQLWDLRFITSNPPAPVEEPKKGKKVGGGVKTKPVKTQPTSSEPVPEPAQEQGGNESPEVPSEEVPPVEPGE